MRPLPLLLVALLAVGAARKPVTHKRPTATPAPMQCEEDLFPLPTKTPPVVVVKSSRPAPKPGMQTERWRAAKVNARDLMRADGEVAFYMRNRAIYEKLEAMGGVPAPVIFGFHTRESGHSFGRHLHEGSLLTHRTVDEPKGRIPNIPPPYTFLQSAQDALYGYEHLERRDWQHVETALQAAESYNGLGYQRRGRVSPYMWAGTNVYQPPGGKYVADGRYDAHAYDKQLGVCAILKRLEDHGIIIAFK